MEQEEGDWKGEEGGGGGAGGGALTLAEASG